MKNKSRQDLFFIKLYNLVVIKIQVDYVQIPYQIKGTYKPRAQPANDLDFDVRTCVCHVDSNWS